MNINKKPGFYTNTSPYINKNTSNSSIQTNQNNLRKYKFSNFTGVQHNTNASSISNNNSNNGGGRATNSVVTTNYNNNFNRNSYNNQRNESNGYQASQHRSNTPKNNIKINDPNNNTNKQQFPDYNNLNNNNINNPKITSITNNPQYKSIQAPIYASNSLRSQSPVAVDTSTNTRKQQQPQQIKTIKIQQKCIVCQTPTEKCCSLCRKVFYCSGQHQEVDWHTKHKFVCEGRQAIGNSSNNMNSNYVQNNDQQNNSNKNKFIFYSNSHLDNANSTNQKLQRQIDYQAIHRFLQMLSQRLVMRTKILNQVNKLNERTPSIVRQSLITQTQKLVQLSAKITHEEFKPSFSSKISRKDILEYSSQQWGSQVVIDQVSIGLEYIADLVLMAKMYHLGGKNAQTREYVIMIGRLLEDSEQVYLFLSAKQKQLKNSVNLTSSTPSPQSPSPSPSHPSPSIFRTTTLPYHSQSSSLTQQSLLSLSKTLILSSIIQLSQLYNIDKTTQIVYKIYIKRIQLYDGVWEQIYAYFNMGVWYSEKTYYQKAIKCYIYCISMLDSHRSNNNAVNNNTNIGIGSSNMSNSANANSNQQSNIPLKSDCLFNLACAYWSNNEPTLAIQNMQQCYKIRINTIGKNSMQCSYCLIKLAKWYKNVNKWNQCLQYLDQCHRIRKLYDNQKGVYTGKLQEIKMLIAEVYQIMKKQKRKGEKELDPHMESYYSRLLQKQHEEQQRTQYKRIEQGEQLDKGTIASRLFRDDRQYVKFKVIISQQFWNTVSSDQAKFLSDLINYTDQKMQKSQAIKILMQNSFVQSLNSEQRDMFFKENQIGKTVSS